LRRLSKPSTGAAWARSSALPCGNALGDVEQDDVAQLANAGEVRQRAADHPDPMSAILLRAISPSLSRS
jgi:hypothetical protein